MTTWAVTPRPSASAPAPAPQAAPASAPVPAQASVPAATPPAKVNKTTCKNTVAMMGWTDGKFRYGLHNEASPEDHAGAKQLLKPDAAQALLR